MDKRYAEAVEFTTRYENMDLITQASLKAFQQQFKEMNTDSTAQQRAQRIVDEASTLLSGYLNKEEASNFEGMLVILQEVSTWLWMGVERGVEQGLHDDPKELATGMLAAFSRLALKCVNHMIDEDNAKKATQQ